MLEDNSIAVILMFIMSIMLIVVMGFIIWFLMMATRGIKKVSRWTKTANSLVPSAKYRSNGLVNPVNKGLSKHEVDEVRAIIRSAEKPHTTRRVIEVVEYDQ